MSTYFRICLLVTLFFKLTFILKAALVANPNAPNLQKCLLFGYEAIEHMSEPIHVDRRDRVQAQYLRQQNPVNNPADSVFQHYLPQNIQAHPQNHLALYVLLQGGINFQAIYNHPINRHVRLRRAAALAIHRLNLGINVRFRDISQIYNVATLAFHWQPIAGVEIDDAYIERALKAGGNTTLLANALISLTQAPMLNVILQNLMIHIQNQDIDVPRFIVLHYPCDRRVSKNLKEVSLNCIAAHRPAGHLQFNNVQMPIPEYITVHQQILDAFNLQQLPMDPGQAAHAPLNARSVGSVVSYYSSQNEYKNRKF